MDCSDSGLREPPLHARYTLKLGLVIAALVGAYWGLFPSLHDALGNRAFALGLIPCLTAGVLLGVRGAVLTTLVVVLLDRSQALRLGGPDLGLVVGMMMALIKLALAGGMGLVFDSRRRLHRTNAQLQRETRAHGRTAASLARSEKLHRALVESLGEGVGLFDAEDRLVFANEALATTLQCPREELVGQPFSKFLSDASKAQAEHLVGNESPRSYDVVLADAHATPLLVTHTSLEAEPHKPAMTLRVVRDLTERVVSEHRQRDLERQMERAQTLQSLALLAGGVAHDFNNLLCGVVGNAELAERKLPRNASPQLSRCLSEIRSFAEQAAQLSRQMLSFAGRQTLTIEAIDTNSELREALRLLHATIESKARLLLDLTPDLPEAAADRFQLRRVVTNLVLNALDAMDGKRGTLTIRTENTELDRTSAMQRGLAQDGYVKVTVSDTGHGIAEANRERIFDPYFSTKSQGRGMGLAAALGIIRAHRGWLGVEKVSTAGTTFSILLPLARATTPRATADAPPISPRLRSRNILLIDDEPAVRLVTSRLLVELGQRVVTADGGARGLELFQSQADEFDLVLLDLTMPGQSGQEILGALRQLRQDVRVVITSGFHAQDASGLLHEPNVVGFLDKPHSLTNLESLLASVNERSQAPATPSASSDTRWN